jgi:hypothetical protein
MCYLAKAHKLRYNASLSCGSVRLANKLRIQRSAGGIPRIESFGYRESRASKIDITRTLGGDYATEDSRISMKVQDKYKLSNQY